MRKMAWLLLMTVCVSGCNRSITQQPKQCDLPEVRELEKFSSEHQLHVEVIDTFQAFKYHVRLWPYSEGYEYKDWAWTGASDSLNEAIREAEISYEEDHKTVYRESYAPPKTLCKR